MSEHSPLLPLRYEDGLHYCTVTDFSGASFALTVQPDAFKLLEKRAAAYDQLVAARRPPSPTQTGMDADMTDNVISLDARRKLSRLAKLKAVRSAVEFRAVERILHDIWADRQSEKPPEFGAGGIDDLPV